VTCAIATAMALFGEPRLAAGTLVAFHCLLRAREMLSVTKDDVVDGRDPRLDPTTARTEIIIRDAKGGVNQCVHVNDPQVLRLLHSLLDTTGAGQHLFGAGPSSYGAFYRLWRRVINEFGIDSRFVPHSLRHGGATACFMAGVPMADIKSRGRWVRLETAQHYVQTARALVGGALVPVAVSTLGQRAALDITRALALAQSHSVAGGAQSPAPVRR
jgi:integrase